MHIGVPALLGCLFLLALAWAAARLLFFRRVEQGRALIVTRGDREPSVSFTGAVVLPILDLAEVLDITLKTVRITREGPEGLEFRDGARADVSALFYVRTNKTREDVLKVAQTLGCARASDPAAIEEVFAPVFASALATAASKLAYDKTKDEPEVFVELVVEIVGRDLNGFVLDNVAVERLESAAARGYRG